MDYMINFFMKYLEKNNLIESKTDGEKIKYSLSIILSELFKFVGISIIFIILNKFTYFVFASILILLTRTSSGGMHFYKTYQCFIFSLIFFISSVLILPLIKLTYNQYIFISILSTIIALTCAPVFSKYRTFLNKKKLKFKISAFVLTTVCFMVLFIFFYNTQYFYCGIWTLFLQNIQLLYSRGRLFYEKNFIIQNC